MRNYFTLLLSLFVLTVLNAQTNSNGNGNWNNGPTWDTGATPPDNGDSIIVNGGNVVTLDLNTTYTNPVVIVVTGTLVLDATLELPSGSIIYIEAGGMVTSGNNGWRLDIGSQSWGGLKNNPLTEGIITDVVLSSTIIELEAEVVSASKDITINWVIDETEKLQRLIIQKSIDGESFVDFQEVKLNTNNEIILLGFADSKETFVRFKAITEKGSRFSRVVKLINEDLNLGVYPNPFNNFVAVNNPFDEEINVEIMDVLGNKVVSQTLTNTKVNTSMLTSGIYFINISKGSQLLKSERFLKK